MIKEYLKLGRIEFAGFLICVMLSGALCIKGVSLIFMETLPLVFIAIITNIWGFAHNDYHDVKVDSHSPELAERPLISGTVTPRAAITLVYLAIIVVFLISLIISPTILTLLTLVISAIMAGVYNIYSKRIPGMDLAFAASTALLCLLGALLVSGPPLNRETLQLLALVATIYFLDNIIFNAGATLKDIKNDSAAGARTVAVALGVKVGEQDELLISPKFISLLLFVKTISLILLVAAAFFYTSTHAQTVRFVLPAAALISFYLTADAFRLKKFDRKEIGQRWLKQEAACKLLLPLFLLPIIGYFWFLFLSLFPFFWFWLWTVLLYGKGNKLPKGF